MALRFLLAILATLFVFGCNGGNGGENGEGIFGGIGSVEELETAHRSGLIQLEGASARLTEAYDEALRIRSEHEASGDTEGEIEAVQAIIEFIDSAAGGLAEAAYEAPDAQQLRSESAKYDELRLSMIQAANDAFFEVSSAFEIADGIAISDPNYEELTFRLMMAKQDIEGVVRTLGGSLESDFEDEQF